MRDEIDIYYSIEDQMIILGNLIFPYDGKLDIDQMNTTINSIIEQLNDLKNEINKE